MNDNPFQLFDRTGQPVGWAWVDETGCFDRVYPTHHEALRSLVEYMASLHGYRPWYTRLWDFLKQVWRDETTLPRR